jgi:hypothetical protein
MAIKHVLTERRPENDAPNRLPMPKRRVVRSRKLEQNERCDVPRELARITPFETRPSIVKKCSPKQRIQ